MLTYSWLQIIALVALLALTSPLLGRYIAHIFSDHTKTNKVEAGLLWVIGVDRRREQRWRSYAISVLAFSAAGIAAVYAFQRLQSHLPLNPDDQGAVNPLLALNTAVSFVTNTNWQNYGGESTMAHITQMAALGVQNFLSAAVGLTVAIALIRGLTRSRSETIGNFWVDLTKGVLRLLLPLAFTGGLLLASQGVVQNLNGAQTVSTLKALDSPSRRAPSQVRKPSKSLVRMVAGSQTPIPRTHTKTPRDSPTLSRFG